MPSPSSVTTNQNSSFYAVQRILHDGSIYTRGPVERGDGADLEGHNRRNIAEGSHSGQPRGSARTESLYQKQCHTSDPDTAHGSQRQFSSGRTENGWSSWYLQPPGIHRALARCEISHLLASQLSIGPVSMIIAQAITVISHDQLQLLISDNVDGEAFRGPAARDDSGVI